METWSPYKEALARLVRMSATDLSKYILLRLTGREADPEYDWSRNQEAPEDFLLWANSVGGPPFRDLLRNCIKELLTEHMADWLGSRGQEREDVIVSRLVYLGEVGRIEQAVTVLQDSLVERGKLRLDSAQRLQSAGPVPWGETLLHQSLGALSVLEGLSPDRAKARAEFWWPILEGRFEGEAGLRPSLRSIAFHRLVQTSWVNAVEIGFYFAVQPIVSELNQGQGSKFMMTRRLAGLIGFLFEESLRQKTRLPPLVEDPTPLAQAFQRFATNETLIGMFEEALKMVATDSDAVGSKFNSDEWLKYYVPATLDEVREGMGSVPCLVRQERMVGTMDPASGDWLSGILSLRFCQPAFTEARV